MPCSHLISPLFWENVELKCFPSLNFNTHKTQPCFELEHWHSVTDGFSRSPRHCGHHRHCIWTHWLLLLQVSCTRKRVVRQVAKVNRSGMYWLFLLAFSFSKTFVTCTSAEEFSGHCEWRAWALEKQNRQRPSHEYKTSWESFLHFSLHSWVIFHIPRSLLS